MIVVRISYPFITMATRKVYKFILLGLKAHYAVMVTINIKNQLNIVFKHETCMFNIITL